MKKNILIIDDDIDTLDLTSDFLSSEGYNVYTALSGIQMFECLRNSKSIDVILLDIMMDWINGLDLCKAVKSSDEFKHIPIIIISARNSEDDIELAYSFGATDYLPKPFELAKLRSKLNYYLNFDPVNK